MTQNVAARTGLASIIAPNSPHITPNSLSKRPVDQVEEIEEAKEVHSHLNNINKLLKQCNCPNFSENQPIFWKYCTKRVTAKKVS